MNCKILIAVLATISCGIVDVANGQAAGTGQTPGRTSSQESKQSEAATKESSRNSKRSRLREGTKLEGALGRFEITGSRIMFYSANGLDPIRVLENLALERITRELTGIARQRQWKITGLVTEFQSGNYLLVQRATLTTDTAQ